MPDVFTELERSWRALSRSNTGAAALRRWGQQESELAEFDSLDDFVLAAQGAGEEHGLDDRDELQLALLRCARHDVDARFTMLAILRPGLTQLARRSAAQWGFEETAAAIIGSALEAIVAYPEGRARPSACIIRHARHALWLKQWRERRLVESLGREMALDERDLMPATEATSAGEEVLRLVGEAVTAGKVTAEHGRLVIFHRVLGVSTRDIAAELGRPVGTVRQQRRRAEAAIARLALRAAA